MLLLVAASGVTQNIVVAGSGGGGGECERDNVDWKQVSIWEIVGPQANHCCHRRRRLEDGMEFISWRCQGSDGRKKKESIRFERWLDEPKERESFQYICRRAAAADDKYKAIQREIGCPTKRLLE